MANWTVKVTFLSSVAGSSAYDFLLVQNISIPKEGEKATVIKGTRGDGSIIIAGGKRSQEIVVKGKIWGDDYVDLITKINALKVAVTTAPATLTLQHYDPDESGSGWITDTEYTVKRIEEITFGDSMLTDTIDYSVNFIVISY